MLELYSIITKVLDKMVLPIYNVMKAEQITKVQTTRKQETWKKYMYQ